MFQNYEKLGLVGQIWCIREEVSLGIIFKNQECFKSGVEKLNKIAEDEKFIKSNALLNEKENVDVIYDLINNVQLLEQKHIYNQEVDCSYNINNCVVTKVWRMAAKLGYLKYRLINEESEIKDINVINTIFDMMKKIQRKEKEDRKLSAKERRDLHFIYLDIAEFETRFNKELDKKQNLNI